MNNGSLLFTRVNQNHQGRYTCTPYNAQGTQGSSGNSKTFRDYISYFTTLNIIGINIVLGPMEVLVRKPPVFTVEPDALYQRKVIELCCNYMSMIN